MPNASLQGQGKRSVAQALQRLYALHGREGRSSVSRWAATNTLRAAHRDVDAPACNPDCPWCSALSLVEAALDAAERVQEARGYMRDSVEAHRALAAALRALR